MECKHCRSKNTELRKSGKVERKNGTQFMYIYDCNNCGKESSYYSRIVRTGDDNGFWDGYFAAKLEDTLNGE